MIVTCTTELLRRVMDASPGALTDIKGVLDAYDARRKAEAQGSGPADVYRLWKGDGWWNVILRGERDVFKDDRRHGNVQYPSVEAYRSRGRNLARLSQRVAAGQSHQNQQEIRQHFPLQPDVTTRPARR